MAPAAMYELLDAGPDFNGWFGEVEGLFTCLLSVLVLTEPTVREYTEAAARRRDIDCSTCVQAGCPLFRLVS